MVPGALFLRYPDIQIQAVLGEFGVRVPHLLANEPGKVLVSLLVTRVWQSGGVQHSRPWIDGHRAPKPERAYWRLGERYTRVHPHLTVRNDFRVPLNQAGAGHHHRALVGVFHRRPTSTTTGASTASTGSGTTPATSTATTIRSAIRRRPAQDGRTTQQQRHCTGVNAVDAHFSKNYCAHVGVLAAATAIRVGSTENKTSKMR